MGKQNKFSPEVRERAVRLVQEHRGDYPSLWAAVESIAPKIGCVGSTLLEWVRRAETDSGLRPGVTTDERERIKALAALKQRIRQLTRRAGGRSMPQVVDRLRSYLLGWKGYFRLAQTPNVWRKLDEWLRHRLRATQLKQWRRGTTMFRENCAHWVPVRRWRDG